MPPPNSVLKLPKPSLRSGFRSLTLLRWADDHSPPALEHSRLAQSRRHRPKEIAQTDTRAGGLARLKCYIEYNR